MIKKRKAFLLLFMGPLVGATVGPSVLTRFLQASSGSGPCSPLSLGKTDSDGRDARRRAFELPENIMFNHKYNLLNDPTSVKGSDLLLLDNVMHSLGLHPNKRVIFYGDDDCNDAIQKYFGPRESIVEWFNNPSLHAVRMGHSFTDGKFKSDLCRLVQLFEHGGLYLDTDLQLMVSIDDLPNHAFASVLESRTSAERGIFQALVSATKAHPVIGRALAYFAQWARGGRNVTGLLGPSIMRSALDDEYFKDYEVDASRGRLDSLDDVILLEEVEPKEFAGFLKEQSECLAKTGVRRTNHHRENNLCGYLVVNKNTQSPVAYSRMMRSGKDGGSRACVSEEAEPEYLCKCTNSGAVDNGYNCSRRSRVTSAYAYRSFCSIEQQCVDGSSWDPAFEEAACRSRRPNKDVDNAAPSPTARHLQTNHTADSPFVPPSAPYFPPRSPTSTKPSTTGLFVLLVICGSLACVVGCCYVTSSVASVQLFMEERSNTKTESKEVPTAVAPNSIKIVELKRKYRRPFWDVTRPHIHTDPRDCKRCRF